MQACDLLITCASWEERFGIGLAHDLESYRPAGVFMFYLDQYEEWSAEARINVSAMCAERQITLRQRRLNWDQPATNWRALRECLLASDLKATRVVVDLTTMPREVIWAILWLLEYRAASIHYVYHRPQSYNSDWLSRDPGKPRLVYKMGGVARLGARTALVSLAGFDRERTGQLIQHFEPSVTLLGLQHSDGDAQNDARMRAHADYVKQFRSAETFAVNAYAADHGQAAIERAIEKHLNSHNLILSSLGPKLSAVALYRIHRRFPDVGLAYAPSREYNQAYSAGLQTSYDGAL